MIRKFTRVGAVLAAVLGTLAALLIAAPSATAAPAAPSLSKVHVCLAFAAGCVGAPNLGNGDPVELTGVGRELNFVDQGFKCCDGTMEVYRIQLSAAPTQCLGETQKATVTLRNCSGGNASMVNWARAPQSNGNIEWLNRPLGGVLTAPGDNLGEQLTVTDGCTGCLLQWLPAF